MTGDNGEALLTPKEASRLLGLAVQTLARKRVEGSGPPFLRLGGPGAPVRYKRAALLAWAEQGERRSTSEPERTTPPAGSGRAA